MLSSCSLPSCVCIKEINFGRVNLNIPPIPPSSDAFDAIAFYRTRKINLSGKPTIVAVYSRQFGQQPTSQDLQHTIQEDRIRIRLRTTKHPLPISYFTQEGQTDHISAATGLNDFQITTNDTDNTLTITFLNHIRKW